MAYKASSPKVFNKVIESNPNIDYAINTVITEYDIKRCHPSMMYFIKGQDFYKKLMEMPKLESNIVIGKMMTEDKNLFNQISEYKLKCFNEFCSVNNIKDSNFISSTPDSMILVGKKPLKTTFYNGVVTFRNKDGDYTSYVRLKSKQGILEILFDGMSNNLRIKGITGEVVDKQNAFIRYFKQVLTVLENSNSMQTSEIFKKTAYLRKKYVESRDPNIYRSLRDGGKYVYEVNGERITCDDILKNPIANLVKTDNFINLILPIFKLCFRPH